MIFQKLNAGPGGRLFAPPGPLLHVPCLEPVMLTCHINAHCIIWFKVFFITGSNRGSILLQPAASPEDLRFRPESSPWSLGVQFSSFTSSSWSLGVQSGSVIRADSQKHIIHSSGPSRSLNPGSLRAVCSTSRKPKDVGKLLREHHNGSSSQTPIRTYPIPSRLEITV